MYYKSSHTKASQRTSYIGEIEVQGLKLFILKEVSSIIFLKKNISFHRFVENHINNLYYNTLEAKIYYCFTVF